MATMYSGFASRRMEELYVQMTRKAMSMMSLKVLYAAAPDFLTATLKE